MEKKVVIDISTDIARILDIDEIAGIFHVQFFLSILIYFIRVVYGIYVAHDVYEFNFK